MAVYFLGVPLEIRTLVFATLKEKTNIFQKDKQSGFFGSQNSINHL